MSDIPQASEIVAAVAAWLEEEGFWDEAYRLRRALGLMRREPYARERAPTKSRPVDARIAEAMRTLAYARPDLTLQEIAVLFGTNSGRVTEALQGRR